MKLTLSNIKELKRKSDSPLTRRVCNYVIDRWAAKRSMRCCTKP